MALIDEYIENLVDCVEAYKTYWVSPYCRAYVAAYTGFNKAQKAQADWDKLKFELFLTAASIGFGGAMGAIFGKTALSTIAGDAAITQICNRNMTRTFNVIAGISASKPGSFIAGAIWDKVSSKVSGEVTSQMQALFKTAPAKEQAIRDPLVMYIDLNDFVARQGLVARAVGKAIRKSTLISSDEKESLANAMMAAPFYANKPGSEVIPLVDQAAKVLELSFYMVQVMDLDYVLETTYLQQATREGTRTRDLGRISALTTAKDYGKLPAMKSQIGGAFAQTSLYSIGYDSLGGKIVERINELYQGLFKTDFIDDHWYGVSFDGSQITKAEQTLVRLNGMVPAISF